MKLVKIGEGVYRTEDCSVFVSRSIMAIEKADGKWKVTHRGYPLATVDTLAAGRLVIRDLYRTNR
jgi:hypothetical protein